MSAVLKPHEPTVDLAEASRFLAMLAEGAPVTFQTFDDDAARKHPKLASIAHCELDACSARLTNLNAAGAGIFWMVNCGDGAGRANGNVTCIRALFLDLDGAPLGPVLAAGVDPHAVVESSPGKWHVYWMVTGCPLAQFKPAQQALAAKFGGDVTVCDLPRVLRVPGFLHRKGEPFATRIVSMEPMQPYTFGTLVQRLGLDLSAPAPAAPRVAAATGEIVGKVTAGGRHEHLRRKLADLNWRGIPEAGIRAALHQINDRECEPPKTAPEVEGLVTDWLKRYASQNGEDLKERQHVGGASLAEEQPRPFFVTVPIADLDTVELPPQVWYWDGYIPADELTLMTAHGGAGKSMVMLMLAVCATLGLPLFGVATRPCRVLYFSAEDPANTVRRRVQSVCRHLGVSASMLADRMTVLDATDGAPVLFAEQSAPGGVRYGVTTPTHQELDRVFAEVAADLLIVDNASDTYSASEIDRARVREFVRSLVALVRKRHGAVCLLAHVSKNTAKGLDGGSRESYSGSTAWHNSARSRLTLSRAKDGPGLTLEHEKSQHGSMREPLRLVWPKDGLPQLDEPTSGVVQSIATENNTKVLLKLIHEFTARGEYVSTATTSRTHAAKLLRGEPGFPKRMRDGEVFDLLRQAERRGWLGREEHRGADRKPREAWSVTPAGAALAGIPESAATAATAATSAVTAPAAPGAVPAEPCGDCGDLPPGGVGGRARTEVAAAVGAGNAESDEGCV